MLSGHIQIPLFGIRTEIAPDTPMDQPAGASTYVFEYFDSDVELEDASGLHFYPGNVCILYPPGQEKFYRASKHSHRTWFHLQGDGLIPSLERDSIPVSRSAGGSDFSLSEGKSRGAAAGPR